MAPASEPQNDTDILYEAIPLSGKGNKAKAITIAEFMQALEKIGYMDEDEYDAELICQTIT